MLILSGLGNPTAFAGTSFHSGLDQVSPCIAPAQSVQERRLSKASDNRPFSERFHFTINLDHAFRPTGVDLLFAGRTPSHISGSVPLVVVDPIQGVCKRRAGSDIPEKSLKAISPRVAHGDASAAVVTPSAISRVEAALFHVGPDFVLRRSRLVVSREHRSDPHARDGFLQPETPARLAPTSEQAVFVRGGLTPAVASADPAPLPMLSRS